MKTLKIFLASSNELEHERLIIAEQIGNMKNRLAEQEIMLKLVKWEYLDSSMGAQHKQEDYNDQLVDCDMCFALFWTKFGMYTEIEFEKSLREMTSKGKMRSLCVLFKNSDAKSEELRAFEKKCSEEYPDLCHTFENDETLREIITAEIEGFLSDKSYLEKGMKERGESKSNLQTVRIFLSIDKDLEQERLQLMDLVENLNHSLESRNANILMMAWDNSSNDSRAFDDEISKTDLCLNLYYINFNNTTQTELESAYQALCDGRNPKKIYVYFKDGASVPEQLQEFRDSFPTKYGHFYCSYSNIDTLKADFLLQFMEYQSKNMGGSKMFEVTDGKVILDGKEYVDLMNVPFAGNNEEYNALKAQIQSIQEVLTFIPTDNPMYSKKAEELLKLKEKMQAMESSLWDTALMITRLSTTKCSERLERAMQLFNKGDNKGALAVLNEEEIEKDAQHNINLIKLGETGREGLKTNIQEFEMRISSLKSEMTPGWLQEIITLREKILEWTKILFGTESVEYAEAMTELGHSLSENGNYSQARDYHLKALSIRKEALGERHPSTAGSYNNIANVYYKLGEYKKALDYDLKALSIMREALGKKHPDTARTYSSIANVYFELREYEKALDYHLKALSIRKEALGEKHPDTANSYNNIANIYYKHGEFKKALDYHLKALSIKEDVLDEKHPDTANSYNNIGLVYGELGDYEKALDYHLKALYIKEDVLGEKHPDTATSYNNIGIVYEELGDYDEALDYLLKALSIMREALGKKHPDTARTYSSIANIYYKHGEFKKALDYHLKALSIRKEVLGEKHPDTATSYNNIANVYYELAEYEKALDYHLKALSIMREALGEKHPDTAGSYDNIGLVYNELAEYEKALDYHLKALSIRKEVLGEKHPDTANSYNNIANIYYKHGEFKKALDYHLKALYIKEDVLGEKHPDTATSYDNIGLVYNELAEYEKALDYHLKALSIRKEVLGEKHPDTARTYNNIASVYFELREYEKALDYYLMALSIIRDAFGENHPYTDVLYRNLGSIFYRISDLDNAEFYYEKLALRRNSNDWNMLSYIYFRKGMHDKALDAIDNALTLEPSNPHCLDTKGEHLFNLGRYDEAREMWQEVIKLDPEFDKHVDSALFKGLKSKGLI